MAGDVQTYLSAGGTSLLAEEKSMLSLLEIPSSSRSLSSVTSAYTVSKETFARKADRDREASTRC